MHVFDYTAKFSNGLFVFNKTAYPIIKISRFYQLNTIFNHYY